MNTNKERIVSLDLMRGIAIFGIFLVNMLSFHSPILYVNPQSWWDEGMDKDLYRVIDVLIQRSFYPLFALLFGYSFVLFREKIRRQQKSFPLLATRRLFSLLAMGLVHAFLIWHGDILITYAVFGFVLLLFLGKDGKSLLLTGIVMYTIPILLFLTMFSTLGMTDDSMAAHLPNHEAVQQSINHYQQGTLLDIAKQRFTDWHQTNNLENGLFIFVSIFPLFLIGAGMAKLKWLEHPQKIQQRVLVTILGSSLFFGLLLKSLPYFIGRTAMTEYIQAGVGAPLLSVFYAAAVLRLLVMKNVYPIFRPLIAVGRMSITNYLLQSIMSTFIFYHYGLGLYGKVSLTEGTAIVLVIFLFQAAFSQWWLGKYTYGPIELIWRRAIYWKSTKVTNRS